MKIDDPILSRPRLPQVRDESVLLGSDLVRLDEAETKIFNQAIRRNTHRFPPDFAFRLTDEESVSLKSQIVTSNGRGGRRYLTGVFIQYGTITAATILNSDRAVAMSTYVVRAFVRLLREVLGDAALEVRLRRSRKSSVRTRPPCGCFLVKSNSCGCRPPSRP